MLKKAGLFLGFLSLFVFLPVKVEAKKRRIFLRKWSVSMTNGYSFYQNKKGSAKSSLEWGGPEGQMNLFFSSLEISRNLGYYEIGAKIQNLGPAFISPFIKINFVKNNSRASIVPSFSWGFIPSHILGSWFRLNLSLSINRYVTFTPFIGSYAWYKIKDDAQYEKYNFYFNTGLSINLYY